MCQISQSIESSDKMSVLRISTGQCLFDFLEISEAGFEWEVRAKVERCKLSVLDVDSLILCRKSMDLGFGV
jgi:hypothetical protein